MCAFAGCERWGLARLSSMSGEHTCPPAPAESQGEPVGEGKGERVLAPQGPFWGRWDRARHVISHHQRDSGGGALLQDSGHAAAWALGRSGRHPPRESGDRRLVDESLVSCQAPRSSKRSVQQKTTYLRRLLAAVSAARLTSNPTSQS